MPVGGCVRTAFSTATSRSARALRSRMRHSQTPTMSEHRTRTAEMDRAIVSGAGHSGGGEDSDDRAELEAAIEAGYLDFEAGDYEDARTYAERLLAKT